MAQKKTVNLETMQAAWRAKKDEPLFDGIVIRYDGDIGVIKDCSSGAELSFCKEDLIESVSVNQRVLYTTIGSKATYVHKGQNAASVIELGETWKRRSGFSKAVHILEHVCRKDPVQPKAEELLRTCKSLWLSNLIKEIKDEDAKRNYIGVLQKQKDLLDMVEPDHEKTLRGIIATYPKAINQCDKEEEKTKLRQEAKVLIHAKKNFFLSDKKKCFMAFSTCVAIKNFEDVDEFADELQEYYDSKVTVSQYCHFMQQRAVVKIQKKDRKQALAYFEAIKRKNPSFPNIDKFIQILQDEKEDIDNVFELANGSAPLSDYSRMLVQNQEKKEREEVNAELKKLEQAKATTKEEKAEILLKKIRLSNNVNDDISKDFYDYYKLKSQLLFAEKKYDSGRFLCREAISVYTDNEELQNLMQALYYVSSFLGIDIGELNSKAPKTYEDRKTSLIEFISKFINQNKDAFDALALLSNCNNETVNNCIFEVFEKLEDKSQLLDYVGYDSNNEESETPNITQIKTLWGERIRQEFSQFNDIKMEYMSVVHDGSLESVIKYLYAIKKEYAHPWLSENDKSLTRDFADKLPDLLSGFLNESKYIPKKSRLNLIKVNLERWNELGQGNLSDFYVCIAVPFLTKIQEIVEKDFEDFSRDSSANLVLHALNNEITQVGNIIEIQLSIENTSDRAPFPNDIDISVESKTPCQFIIKNIVDLANVNSQKSNVAIKKIFLELKEVNEKNIELQFICNDNKTGNILAQEIFAFNIHQESEFSPIKNKFENYASGVVIKKESDMYYGRQQDIDELVDAIRLYSNKHFLIYGQNRCGKSSTVVQIIKRLANFRDIVCVSINLDGYEDVLKKYGEIAIYEKILDKLVDYVDDNPSEFKGEFELPDLSELAEESAKNTPQKVFKKYLNAFRRLQILGEGEPQKRIFVAIDEFSCLYSLMHRDEFPKLFMKQWKSLNEDPKTEFSAILVGQNVMQRFMEEPYASNAFQSIEAHKMTYLEEADARNLVEKPIAMPTGKSRYLGKSVDAILEFTSRNPFYIQLFCSELVKYENKRMSTYITEADVFFVANELMKNGVLTKKDFMNLLLAGQPDPPLFPECDTMSVLTQIAVRCNELEYCPIYAISNPPSGECNKESIVQHLVNCDVLEHRGNEFKIVIRLYQDWLFQNRI